MDLCDENSDRCTFWIFLAVDTDIREEKRKDPFCLPEGNLNANIRPETILKVLETVFEYLRDHRSQWDQQAEDLLEAALAERWPCE